MKFPENLIEKRKYEMWLKKKKKVHNPCLHVFPYLTNENLSAHFAIWLKNMDGNQLKKNKQQMSQRRISERTNESREWVSNKETLNRI